MQWWIDTFGKIAPLAVSLAVYFLTRSQAQFQRVVGMRAALIEDQKLRLALLDRRISAYNGVRIASSEFAMHARLTSESIELLRDALNIAELVYDEEEEAAISSTLGDLFRWQIYNDRADGYGSIGSDREDEARASQYEIEDRLATTLPGLRDRLRDVSRIRQIEPLGQQRRRFKWVSPNWPRRKPA